jgi:hypothetical protein
MKTTTTRLTLNRESIRDLSAGSLRGMRGGGALTGDVCTIVNTDTITKVESDLVNKCTTGVSDAIGSCYTWCVVIGG